MRAVALVAAWCACVAGVALGLIWAASRGPGPFAVAVSADLAGFAGGWYARVALHRRGGGRR